VSNKCATQQGNKCSKEMGNTVSLAPDLQVPLGPRSPGFHLFSGPGSSDLCPLALGTAVLALHAGIGGLQLPTRTWAPARTARSPCSLRRESEGLGARNRKDAGRRKDLKGKALGNQARCKEA
jgi:hypothetical protein